MGEGVGHFGNSTIHFSDITGIGGDYVQEYGVKGAAGIFQNRNAPEVTVREPKIEDMLWLLEQDMLDVGAIINHLRSLSLVNTVDHTMKVLGVASKIYQAVLTASISVEVLNKPV